MENLKSWCKHVQVNQLIKHRGIKLHHYCVPEYRLSNSTSTRPFYSYWEQDVVQHRGLWRRHCYTFNKIHRGHHCKEYLLFSYT